MSIRDMRAGVVLLEGFQELEFWYPILRFREEGIPVTVIGSDAEQTTFSQLGYPVVAEVSFEQVDGGCNVLVVPGTHVPPPATAVARLVAMLQAARQRGALIAVIGNSVRLLAEADLLRGVRVAAAADVADAVGALGATVVGDPVCSDRGVVTARGVDDTPAFFRTLVGARS
jgi:protease I